MGGSEAGRAALRFRGAAGRRGRPADEPPPAAVQETAPKTRPRSTACATVHGASAALSRKTRERHGPGPGLLRGVRLACRLNRVEVLVRAQHERLSRQGRPEAVRRHARRRRQPRRARSPPERAALGRQAGPTGAHRAGVRIFELHPSRAGGDYDHRRRRTAAVNGPCARNRAAARRAGGRVVSRSPGLDVAALETAVCGHRTQPASAGARPVPGAGRIESNISRSTPPTGSKRRTVIAWRLMVMTCSVDVPGCEPSCCSPTSVAFPATLTEELRPAPP